MPQKVHVHHIAAIAKCSGIFGLVSMSEIQKFALALLNEFATAAPSAPAVEQQPVKPWEDRMQEYFAQGSVRMRTPAYFMADEIIDWRKTSPAAPHAADTDKVLTDEEILDVALETIGYNKDCGGKMEIEFARKILAMAAQAPVREVPGGWKLVPIELTDEMRAACINACYADHIDEDWAAMLAAAPLPAAPVQQEGV